MLLNRWFARAIWLVVLMLVVACSPRSLLRRLAPPEADRFARTFIERLRTGDTTAVRSLSPRLGLVRGAPDSLAALRRHFAPGVPDSVALVGARVQQVGSVTWRVMNYQLHSSGGWTQVQLVLAEEQGFRYVDGVDVVQTPTSLQRVHRFALRGKSIFHYLFVLFAVGVAAFSVVTAVRVARTPMPKRWWWAFVALLGAGQVALNWTTGEVFTRSFHVQLFGAGFVREGLIGPWMIISSFPAGAIVALQRRHRALAGLSAHAAGLPPRAPNPPSA